MKNIRLTLLSKLSKANARRLVLTSVKAIGMIGGKVRKDKDGCRYFFQLAGAHYILVARSKVWHPVKVKQGDSYTSANAGFLSIYEETGKVRKVCDTQRKYKGVL